MYFQVQYGFKTFMITSCLVFVLIQGKKEIKIGALIPMTGRWPIGTRIAGAVPLSIHDIMQDKTLLPGYNVTYAIRDSACVPENGMRGMVEFKGMDFILGPACSVVAEPVAILAKIWDKPMITYAASSIKFINKDMFSTLATMTAYGRRNRQYTPAFVARLMQTFNWTVCAILSSSEVEWRTIAEGIRGVITATVHVTMFENYDNKNPHFEQMLTKGKENANVFLLLCYINDVTKIMDAAKRLGMTKGQYAFVTLDLNTDVFYSNGKWTGNDGPGSRFNQGLNGIVDLSVHRPLLSENFKAGYNSMVRFLPMEIRQYLNSNVSWYATFLYDAVWLAALGLNATIADGYDITNTSAVVERMFNRGFLGKSGSVTMENGTRIPYFVVGNIRNGSYVPIVNDSIIVSGRRGSGTIEESLNKVLSIIEWPGGTKEVPRSVPECGFDGKLCIKKKSNTNTNNDHLSIILAVIGSCMFLAVVLGLLMFIRKRQLDKENMYKAWLISYKDLTPSQDHEPTKRMASQISQISDTPSLLFSEFTIPHRHRGLMGAFKIGLYKGKKVYIKRPHHDAISITSEVKNEIRLACELRHVNINPYIGVCVEPLDVCIVTEYCAKGSLQQILLDDNLKLDWTFKMSFAMDIARGMEELHKSPIVSHGKLKSYNVVVDGYWICKVADYGLNAFRLSRQESTLEVQTYSELFWTAPEYLRGTAVPEQSQAGDTYSYAIILQEIALRERPFSTSLLSPKEIIYHVKKGIKPNCRPNIPPDSAPVAYRDLMSMGWDEAPERRPTFTGVLKMLKKINSGKVTNIVDNMLSMMEKYTNNLETLVKERTRQLETEKSKTDELLYKMMPKSVADQLKAGSQMKAESYSDVTIFFSDVVEFTEITARSSPMQVINLLNDLYSLYDTVIARYDVYKVETVGDSCLIVSGLPERNGNRHASEIATMALHLLTYVKDFKIEHLPDMSLQFRMGIHTGPCVAGIVGLKKPRYDIFGESVNVAKHLEAVGMPQKIHVSRTCKAVLDELGGFTVEERGQIFVKGLGETATYYLKGKDSFGRTHLL